MTRYRVTMELYMVADSADDARIALHRAMEHVELEPMVIEYRVDVAEDPDYAPPN